MGVYSKVGTWNEDTLMVKRLFISKYNAESIEMVSIQFFMNGERYCIGEI